MPDPHIDARRWPLDDLEDVTAELGDDNPDNIVLRHKGDGSVWKVKTWAVDHDSLRGNQQMHVLTVVRCTKAGQRRAGAPLLVYNSLTRLTPHSESHHAQVEEDLRRAVLHHHAEATKAKAPARAARPDDDVLAVIHEHLGPGWKPARRARKKTAPPPAAD